MKKSILGLLIALSFISFSSYVPTKRMLSGDKFKRMNRSLSQLIIRPKEYKRITTYLVHTRQQALKKFKLTPTSFNKFDRIVLMEEHDQFSRFRVTGEFYFFDDREPLRYQRLNSDAGIELTDLSISGRSTILKYIRSNQLDSLQTIADNASRQISDGTTITVSIYRDGKAYSFLLPMFSIEE